ncbi:hypothetical protein GJ496_006081 [Pomphorhynchus laevis]|nr:hypothetical protein GJ496_006081 [Pomphorhynchus laevis]
MDQQQNFHQQQQEEVLGYLSVCNYTARNSDQLTLKEHEVVEILDQGDSTYYLVRKYDPKQDIFQYGWVPICILEKREDFLHSTDNLRISEVMHHIRSHICDLTESERQYIQNLECFITSVQDSLTHPNCPLSVKRNTSILLSTIQKIANFHRRLFLHELKKSSDNLQMLGDTFIVNKQQFSLYIDYFTDMNQCEVLFGTQPEIVAFLDDWLYRMTRVDDRPLMFYLTRPIERLEYYREFFKKMSILCD